MQDREYGSTIYTIYSDGEMYYTYTVPNRGGEGEGSVNGSDAPEGTEAKAMIHTHGKVQFNPTNNGFSIGLDPKNYPGDIDIYNKKKIIGFVVQPNGKVRMYDPKKPSERFYLKGSVVFVPSDPNDPTRINNIDPKDNNAPYNDDNENQNKNQRPQNGNSNIWQTINSWLTQNPNIKVTIM